MGEWVQPQDIDPEVMEEAKADLEYDTQVEGAIQKAEGYVRALLVGSGRYPPPAEWTEIIRQAVVKLTVYELYARIEKEEIVQDKRKDAKEMLRALIEGGFAEEGRDTAHPVVSVKEGRKDWYGFS